MASPEAMHIRKASMAALTAAMGSLKGKTGDANAAQVVIALHTALDSMLELARLEGIR